MKTIRIKVMLLKEKTRNKVQHLRLSLIDNEIEGLYEDIQRLKQDYQALLLKQQVELNKVKKINAS